MPFAGEHAARQSDPKKYSEFRRVNDELGEGIDVIYGIYEKDGKKVSEIQSIRFDSGKFTAEEAKKWLKEHDFSTSGFEEASGAEKSRMVIPRSNVLETPILEVIRSKRSNNVPDGALVIPSFASTEAVDYYGTRVLLAAMDDAWPGYMNVEVLYPGGRVMQGNLRYMHDIHRAAGYCRQFERREQGYLAYDTIPKSKKDIQEEILDGILTGTSLGFGILEWRAVTEGDREIFELTKIRIAERSVVDAPATPNCNFQELAQRARHALGEGHTWPVQFRAAEMASPQGSSRVAAETPDDQTKVTSGGKLNLAEEKGYLWFESRPEKDFLPSSLRYGAEDLAGIIMRGGTLTTEITGETTYPRTAVQRVGFNNRSGDGWTEEEISVYLSMRSYLWWDDSGVATEDMPESRSRGILAKFLGIGELDKESVLNEEESRNKDLKESEVNDKELKELMDQQRAAFAESLGTALKPIIDDVALLKRAKEEAAAAEAKRVKDEAEAKRVKDEAAAAAAAAAETKRVKDEADAKAAREEEERRAKESPKPKDGVGGAPAGGDGTDVERSKAFEGMETGMGVLWSKDQPFNIRDVVGPRKAAKGVN